MGENVVVIFCGHVAGKAFFVQRLIAGPAVGKVGVSPATGRGVFFESLALCAVDFVMYRVQTAMVEHTTKPPRTCRRPEVS